METLVSLLVLLIVGIVLGSERQNTQHIIGIRTTTLLLLGSYMFTYISTQIGGDPARIIAQIVTGTGFLSAGVIFKHDNTQINNLTTAVLIWVSAAMGCMIALHMYVEIFSLTAIIYIILSYYKKIFNHE